ncbi:MAG: proton-conducting transporter membrane subunit, partial [Acidobacteriota bacterium]
SFYVSGKVTGISKTYILLSIIFFILNHSFSKTGLFYLTDTAGKSSIEKWNGIFKKNKTFKFLFSTSVLSISGSPPFLGFWAKLLLVMAIPVEYFYVILIILIGSVAEIVYYFRLFNILDSDEGDIKKLKGTLFAPVATVFLLIVSSLIGGYTFFHFTSLQLNNIMMVALGLSIALMIVWFSRAIQWTGSLLILGYSIYSLLPGLEMSLATFFLYLILAGGFLFTIATYPLSKSYKKSFYPLLMVVIHSMAGIILAENWITFFIYWEVMSWSSYLIIYQGKNAKRPSWIYLILSSIGGYAMLAGIKLLSVNSYMVPSFTSEAGLFGLLAPVLIFTAFLVKMATVPFHIWARDAYSESPDGFTPVLSGIMSKVGVFGVIITVAHLLRFSSGSDVILYGLGWLGTLTAFFMTLLAIFQEDAKKVLAYSSVGQIGYILTGIALATSLGYSSALYHTANHLIFKGLLFVAIAGVIYRTGTSKLPELGGLIKKMPFTFFAFLLGIITLAGIPPLSGFAGKWLLYSGMVEKKWMFMLLVSMLASVMAFMYCFKLLHTIFLGQMKPEFKKIKKAPLPIMVVELFFAGLTLLIGAKPGILLKAGEKIIPSLGISDTGYSYSGVSKILSSIGHWNAYALMIFTGITFIGVLIVFYLNNPKIRKVGQLDIGYSGEVPETPEQLHYGYNIYAHFKRAVRFLIVPFVSRIYSSTYRSILSLVDLFRKFYSGDLNTYALWVIITVAFTFYLFLKGV